MQDLTLSVPLTVQAWDPASQRVTRVVYPRNAAAGKSPSLIVDGVDVIAALEVQVKTKAFKPADRTKLRQFSGTNTGIALMDAIAALYLQLDEWESDPRVVEFKMSLGMLRGSVEMISGHYQGIDRLDQLATASKANLLRQACADGRCSLRGNQFVLHESGFFDVWSARRTAGGGSCTSPTSQLNSALLVNGDDVLQRCARNAQTGGLDDNCFGACGLGCTGSIYLPECCGHDNCVRQRGHAACMISTPEECAPPCNSLIEAAAAWWRAKSSTIEQ